MIGRPPHGKRVFSYTNTYGEALTLTIDVDRETAVLTSDDFDPTTIEDDQIQERDLILARDESDWVARVWQEVFDRPLKKLPYTLIEDMLRGMMDCYPPNGDGPRSSAD
jgi:hypothetical protein